VRTWLSWSTGKDCAWALHVLRERDDIEVTGLLTTLDAARDRVAMHDVRRELARAQAEAVGLPLVEVELPWPCSNEEYERRMGAACERARAEGAEAIAFGDLFLEDVRAYREEKLAGSGLEPLFPLWGRDTRALAEEAVGAGLRAVLTSVDLSALTEDFAGRAFGPELLAELPEGVDPCGERGEFHTFVTDGPVFSRPIPVEVGATRVQDGFAYADLTPVRKNSDS
jgi:uncharacterized protein (TIGR00290 family)